MNIEQYREIAQKIRTTVNIVDVMSEHISIKATGKEYKACCPFHDDKSPSMSINASKGVYKCHGCSAGGDVITFHSAINGLSPGESILELARRFNIPLPQKDNAQSQGAKAHQDDLDLLHKAAEQYQQGLGSDQGEAAREHLRGRGVTEMTIRKFGLGFGGAKGSSHSKWSRSQAIRCGLISEEKGYHYMANRVVFPIRDETGRIRGFGGRRIDEADLPKYLNTPETAYFKKSELLYGAFEARQAIAASRQAILVEGYLDVVTAHQEGIENVVGVMSASISRNAIDRLWRRAEEIVICLDGDLAGQNGTMRILREAAPGFVDGKSIRVMIIPGGLDPDEYIRANGRARFSALADEALPASAFIIRALMKQADMACAEGRAGFIRKVNEFADLFTQAPIFAAAMKDQAILQSDLKAVASVMHSYESQEGVSDRAVVIELERIRDTATSLLERLEHDAKASRNPARTP